MRAGQPAMALALLFAVGMGPAAGEARADAIGEANQGCLDCHESDEDSTLTFGDKSTLGVMVDPEVWKKSVHGTELKCTDCHAGIEDHPHPDVDLPTARAYQLDRAGSCKKCHYAYHTRMLDSIHYKELERGNQKAPTCTDCHGAHDVGDPAERSSVTGRCAKCHEDVATAYQASVHGKALQGEHAADVPTCTDCHGAHAIADPRAPQARVSSWTVCGKCHSDEEKMERHGLSADVLTTYLDDFHGRSNALYSQGAGLPGKPIATCVDCHGVHDIQSFREGGATASEVRERVIVACRKCHEGAPVEFADAWLSHYPPTLESAPLVWAVQWGYRILIPLIMAGLVLHILLHLWRARMHR